METETIQKKVVKETFKNKEFIEEAEAELMELICARHAYRSKVILDPMFPQQLSPFHHEEIKVLKTFLRTKLQALADKILTEKITD